MDVEHAELGKHAAAPILGGPVVLAAVALFACQSPSRRAVRIEPAVALRHD